MKKTKKIFSAILVFVLVFSMSTSIFAANNNTSVTVSEYDLLKPYLDKNLSELLEMGLSQEEAQQMLNVQKKVVEKISKYNKYTNEELRQLGHSDKDIEEFNKLQTMDIDSLSIDAIPASIWETVTFTVEKLGKINGDHWFGFEWEWSGSPFVQMTDNIAFAWNNGFEVSRYDVLLSIDHYTDSFDAFAKRYTDVLNPTKDTSVSPGMGFKAKFPMNGGGLENSTYAKKGFGSFTVQNPNNASHMQMVWAYGHSTFHVGGFCLNVGFPSISVNVGAEIMHEDDTKFYNLD